jgi:hypothetical protein
MALPSLSTAKDIYELIKKGATIEAQEKIMEYRQALHDLQEENLELRTKVKDLEEKLEIKGKVIYEAPFYSVVSDDGKKDGPFCQVCYDKDKKLIRLQLYAGQSRWECKVCGQRFHDRSQVSPKSSNSNDDRGGGWMGA